MALDDLLVQHGPRVLMWSWFGALLAVGLWESAAPRSAPRGRTTVRWITNLALTALNMVVARAVYPMLGIGVALAMAERDFGLLRAFDAPYALAVLVSFVALDLRLYVEHRILHHVPVLWRIHRLHHTDLDFDLTTSLRFHPLEALLSTGLRMALIAVLGAPAGAVVLYELIYGMGSFYEHGNVRLPAGLERLVQRVFVTPDFHRLHHSADALDGNANFASIFSVWDRLFGTFRAEPTLGHEAMVVGDAEFQDPAGPSFPALLLLPFAGTGSPASEPEPARS